MLKRILAVMLPLAVAVAFAGNLNNVSTISDPNAKPGPGPAISSEVSLPPGGVDAAPPFGTVVRTYNLSMSGSYAGAGITWRRDSGMFYLMDQGYSGATNVWKCYPSNPSGTLRRDSWTMPNLGSGTRDIPWGIAYDPDSGCFWITNILDGSVYSGCFLVRMNWNGSRWTMGTTVKDTWRIDGVMGAYWLGGIERWHNRWYQDTSSWFAGSPVASGGAANNTVFFDPYHKRVIGHTANGTPPYSERGCALIPYDSNYILTCGWNENNWKKRDSTGTVLQQVSATVYGPADWAVEVEQLLGPDDTVFVWCICSDGSNTLQKISTGISWSQLPSVNPHNVRPTNVLSPVGVVDSGQSIIPRLVVRNVGNDVADVVDVWFKIDQSGVEQYAESTTLYTMPPRSADTVDFASWIPDGRDSMTVTAYVWWAGDSMHRDDTMRTRFLVRVKDIAVTDIISPVDTLDSGVVLYPRARVWNYGNQTQNFDVRWYIGSYTSVRNVTLIPGGATLVTAPDAYTTSPGVYVQRVTAPVAGDQHPENNTKIDTFWVRGTAQHDVGCSQIIAPAGFMDTAISVTPTARCHNYGTNAETFWTWFNIWDSLGTPVYDESTQVMISPNDSLDVQFTPDWVTYQGVFSTRCSTFLVGDQNGLNDVMHGSVIVGIQRPAGDVGVRQITVPAATHDTNATITPTAIVRNYYSEAANFFAWFFLTNPAGDRVYAEDTAIVGLAPNTDITIVFGGFNVGLDTGNWVARCSLYAVSDTFPSNNVLDKPFRVQTTPPPPPGWREVGPMPSAPSGKACKDGGWLAFDASSSLHYAAKGNKTGDFYSYNAATRAWAPKALIPSGTEAKTPSKGAIGCTDGNGIAYATKGNNTQGFYKYTAATDSWKQLPNVPLGLSNKKVKGGTDMVYVTVNDTGYVYLMKGYKAEFYRYNVLKDTWQSLPNVAGNPKCDKGSWLVYDGVSKVYAHKAKYHELTAFDVTTGAWLGTVLKGMPFIGKMGKSKKSKDGGCGAFTDGNIYALKGGNTQEFWKYYVTGDSWHELDTMPAFGSTAKKKKVKAGADIAEYSVPNTLFALKGNKTLECWSYGGTAAYSAPTPRSGALARTVVAQGYLSVTPNPLVSGFATLRYGLPQGGTALVSIVDVTGRTVLTRTLVAGRSGAMSLDLRSLSAGVYLAKISSANCTATHKLVVQH